EFVEIKGRSDAEKFLKKHPEGIMIKSRTGGYDGRGNWLVKDKSDIADAIKHFAGVDLYAEELIDLKQETAVIVARGKENTVVYDPVDTVHVNNICHTVVAPSQADDKTQNKARKIALEVLEKLKGRGVFAI